MHRLRRMLLLNQYLRRFICAYFFRTFSLSLQPMFRRVILYFRKIKLQQKFSLTPLLVRSWNHPLTKTKFPSIFTTEQQVLSPYQPLQTRPTNFFSLQNLVGRAEQLWGEATTRKFEESSEYPHGPSPSLTLPLPFSCSHHLLQLTTKLSLGLHFLHSIILVTLIVFYYYSSFHLLVNLLSFSSVTWQQVQSMDLTEGV